MELHIVGSVVLGTLVGLLAKRKNRSPWLWGIAGAFSWVLALIVLAFMPHLPE